MCIRTNNVITISQVYAKGINIKIFYLVIKKKKAIRERDLE